jgi:ADP-ribosylation factor-like protein 8
LFSFVVDAAAHELLEEAKKELHELVNKPQLNGVPLLVLGNKNDLPNALTAEKLAEVMYVLFVVSVSFHFVIIS